MQSHQTPKTTGPDTHGEPDPYPFAHNSFAYDPHIHVPDLRRHGFYPGTITEALNTVKPRYAWSVKPALKLRRFFSLSIWQLFAALMYALWTLWFGTAITALVITGLPPFAAAEIQPTIGTLFGPIALLMVGTSLHYAMRGRQRDVYQRRKPGVIRALLYGAGQPGRYMLLTWDRPWLLALRSIQSGIFRMIYRWRNFKKRHVIGMTILLLMAVLIVISLLVPQAVIDATVGREDPDKSIRALEQFQSFLRAGGIVVITGGLAAAPLILVAITGVRSLGVMTPGLVFAHIFEATEVSFYENFAAVVGLKFDYYNNLEITELSFLLAGYYGLLSEVVPYALLALVFSTLPRIIENFGRVSAREVVRNIGEESAINAAMARRRVQLVAWIIFSILGFTLAITLLPEFQIVFLPPFIEEQAVIMAMFLVIGLPLFAAKRQILKWRPRNQVPYLFNKWDRYFSMVEHMVDQPSKAGDGAE